MSLINKIIKLVVNSSISDWDAIKFRVETEQRKNLPEICVVDALKRYIDGAWGTPLDRQYLWDEVLKSIKELDAKEAERIAKAQRYRVEDLVPEELKNVMGT